jgi:hypothetical protein
MEKKSKVSKVAKVATGAAFLFFCLLNLKTVFNNNGKVGKSDSNVALASNGCASHPDINWGDCTYWFEYSCDDSWVWHDCYDAYN